MNIDTIPKEMLEIIYEYISHGDRFTLRGVNKSLSVDRMDYEDELRKDFKDNCPNYGNILLLSSIYTLIQDTTEVMYIRKMDPKYLIKYWVLKNMYTPMYLYLQDGYDHEEGIWEELLWYIHKFKLYGSNKIGINIEICIANFDKSKLAVKRSIPLSNKISFTYCPCHHSPGGKYIIPWGVTKVMYSDPWEHAEWWNDPNATHIGLLKFPETVICIDDYTFAECKIDEISFSDSIKKIGVSAFLVSGLKGNLVLPKNLKILEDHAFMGNSQLIPPSKFPHGLVKIGTDIFKECVGWNTDDA